MVAGVPVNMYGMEIAAYKFGGDAPGEIKELVTRITPVFRGFPLLE